MRRFLASYERLAINLSRLHLEYLLEHVILSFGAQVCAARRDSLRFPWLDVSNAGTKLQILVRVNTAVVLGWHSCHHLVYTVVSLGLNLVLLFVLDDGIIGCIVPLGNLPW